MANEIVKVNGVDKKVFNDNILYYFPVALITVNVTNDTYELRHTLNFSDAQTIIWADITDKLGSTDAETYVDALANGGFFFDLSSSGVTQDVNIVSPIPLGVDIVSGGGDATAANQETQINKASESNIISDRIRNIDNSILETLQNIEFYLKAIAE